MGGAVGGLDLIFNEDGSVTHRFWRTAEAGRGQAAQSYLPANLQGPLSTAERASTGTVERYGFSALQWSALGWSGVPSGPKTDTPAGYFKFGLSVVVKVLGSTAPLAMTGLAKLFACGFEPPLRPGGSRSPSAPITPTPPPLQ